jgi:hypothetical protein
VEGLLSYAFQEEVVPVVVIFLAEMGFPVVLPVAVEEVQVVHLLEVRQLEDSADAVMLLSSSKNYFIYTY